MFKLHALDYGAWPTPFVLEQNAVSIKVTSATSIGELATISFTFPADSKTVVVNTVKTLSKSDAKGISWYYLAGSTTLYITGSVALTESAMVLAPTHDPTGYFSNAFAYYLEKQGLSPNIKKGAVNDIVGSTVLNITSPPLKTVMNFTLQYSDNLEAEVLLFFFFFFPLSCG